MESHWRREPNDIIADTGFGRFAMAHTAACRRTMLAIANLQYAWTLFTTDITKGMNAPLDPVQWTLTFFVIAQTVLFPINAYLVDRFGPRVIVTLASVLVE